MTEKQLQDASEKINETHAKVEKIYQAMFGITGTEDKGICGEVKDNTNSIGMLKSRVTKLEVVFYGGGALALILLMLSLFGVKL